MRILVTGQGAREHALCVALSKSTKVRHIYASSDNIGITLLEKVTPIDTVTPDNLTTLIRQYHIDYAVIGPEQDLALGIADQLTAHGVPTIGPNKKATQLESSKVFFKQFATRHQLPQAPYRILHTPTEALSCIGQHRCPFVLKKDGLSAGKGSVVCYSQQQGAACIHQWHADGTPYPVIIEDFILGQEISMMALVNKDTVFVLPLVIDYKSIGQGGLGPNTGGMGAYCMGQSPQHSIADLMHRVIHNLLADGITYCGFLYLGGIIEHKTQQLFLLECNTRLGDPEAQALLPRISSDMSSVFENLLSGHATFQPCWRDDVALTVVLTQPDYPRSSTKKSTSVLLASHPTDIEAFTYASSYESGHMMAHGGRIVSLTTLAPTLYDARHQLYRYLQQTYPLGRSVYYRDDIGYENTAHLRGTDSAIRDLLS